MTSLPWTERTFRFDLPVGLFPSLVERVRGTPARLEELVRPYPARVLTAKINAGWSIQEHVGHLFDLEELHESRLEDFRRKMPTLRAADMSNRRTFEANHNAAPVAEILGRFRTSRMRFVQKLEQLDEAFLVSSALHPRLRTPMRVIDMVYFVAEHDDHHLAAAHRIAVTLK